MSKPLQVHLDPVDIARLDAWARKRGWTKSQAARVAIRALTRPRDDDPLQAASGMIDGLPGDLSARLESHLAETFVAEKATFHRRERARRSVRR